MPIKKFNYLKRKDAQLNSGKRWKVGDKMSGIVLKLTDHESTFKSLHMIYSMVGTLVGPKKSRLSQIL